MSMAQMIFNASPVGKQKLVNVAKGKTYNEFIMYLEDLPNFQVIRQMSFEDKYELYELAKGGF